MTDSHTLLSSYARTGSESAFRELVSRYIDLVYSTAYRLVGGDAQSAQDAAQTVFLALADKAGTLPEDVMLGGWLHQHTRFVAGDLRRTERRRQLRERQAAEMNAIEDHSASNLAQVAPVLDEAIGQLDTEDRTAILLRFFERKDFRFVGEALGSSEEAARKRVDRALEKLHVLLKHRGATLSAAALGTALAAEAVTAAPAGLAGSVAGTALAGTAGGWGTVLTNFRFVIMSKTTFGVIVAAVVAGLVIPVVIRHQSSAEFRQAKQRAAEVLGEGVLKPHLPAPRMPAQAPAPDLSAEDSPSTNLFLRFLKGDAPRLTPAQLVRYLEENHRSPQSLLAAFRTTGDKALLQEAMEKYPKDPRVDFRALVEAGPSAEERRQWLEAFKQSAPDNALPSYLSASDYFKSGQTDQAVQELMEAHSKPHIEEYSVDFIQSAEEAYRAAGYSQAAAAAAALSLSQPSEFKELKQLAQKVVDLAGLYRQAGDESSAQATMQIGLAIGQRLDQPTGQYTLFQYTMGMVIENQILSAMDSGSAYGSAGGTVMDQLNEIANRRAALNVLVQQQGTLLQKLSDEDWVNYSERLKAFGGIQTLQWLVQKYGNSERTGQ